MFPTIALRKIRDAAGISVLAVMFLASAPAHAIVTISTDATTNMNCSAYVCMPTAVDAVLNVGDLENLLALGNVEVTTSGTGVEANDIVVNAALTWPTSRGLTLEAGQSIRVEQPISVSGAGSLAFITNDAEGKGKLRFAKEGNVTFTSITDNLSINGQRYVLADSVAGLAGGIANNPGGSYALANPYDASGDGTYSSAPISTTFTGNFEGLGNTISNLSINSSSSVVGFFAQIGSSASIAGVKLNNLDIEDQTDGATVGGLVGTNNGYLFNDFVKGTLTGTTNEYSAENYFGGLAGANLGTVKFCSTDAEVRGGRGGSASGGLVGENEGDISHADARGLVTGSWMVGGLVGLNSAKPDDSSAVVTESSAGGRVIASWRLGAVGDSVAAGGLVGFNYGFISRSSARGAVRGTAQRKGNAFVGGLVGYNEGSRDLVSGVIKRSYAAGSVSGTGTWVLAGGLVGVTFGTINGGAIHYPGAVDNDYATGAVTGDGSVGTTYIGGLVGYDVASPPDIITTPISSSYSTGAVSALSGGYVGGFIGDNGAASKHAYWDTTTSGTERSVGEGSTSGIMGLTSEQLQSGLPLGFSPTVWGENPNVNNGFPYLLAMPPKQ